MSSLSTARNIELTAKRPGEEHGASRALTLLEVVVSFGILAVLFLSLSILFLNLLGSSTKSAHKTAAMIFAEEVIESVIRKEEFVSVTEPIAERLSATSSERATQFFYTIDCQTIPEEPSVHSGGVFITVRVTWWDDNPDAERAGQGKLSTEAGRFHTPKYSSSSGMSP